MLKSLILALPLLLLGAQAQAQDSSADAAGSQRPTWCQMHADRCAARVQQFRQDCANNPQACAQMRQRMQARMERRQQWRQRLQQNAATQQQ